MYQIILGFKVLSKSIQLKDPRDKLQNKVKLQKTNFNTSCF
jgi:hypothetical protein